MYSRCFLLFTALACVSGCYGRTQRPAAPSDLVATSHELSIGLTWRPTREPDHCGYRVYRSRKGESSWKLLGETTWSSYSDGDVVTGQMYRYFVAAIAGDRGTGKIWESDASNSIEITYHGPGLAFRFLMGAGVVVFGGVCLLAGKGAIALNEAACRSHAEKKRIESAETLAREGQKRRDLRDRLETRYLELAVWIADRFDWATFQDQLGDLLGESVAFPVAEANGRLIEQRLAYFHALFEVHHAFEASAHHISRTLPRTVLEDHIKRTLSDEMPVAEIDKKKMSLLQIIENHRKQGRMAAPKLCQDSVDPMAAKRKSLEHQLEVSLREASASGDEPFVIEARCEQLRQEYTEALLRIERMSA